MKKYAGKFQFLSAKSSVSIILRFATLPTNGCFYQLGISHE